MRLSRNPLFAVSHRACSVSPEEDDRVKTETGTVHQRKPCVHAGHS